MRGRHIVSRLHQRMEHDEIPQIETYFFSVDNVFSRSLDWLWCLDGSVRWWPWKKIWQAIETIPMFSMDFLRKKSMLLFKTVHGKKETGQCAIWPSWAKTPVWILRHWAAGAATSVVWHVGPKIGLLAVWSWSAVDALLLHLVIAPWSSANLGRTSPSYKVPLHRKGLRCHLVATRSLIKSTRVAVNSRWTGVEGGMIELSISQCEFPSFSLTSNHYRPSHIQTSPHQYPHRQKIIHTKYRDTLFLVFMDFFIRRSFMGSLILTWLQHLKRLRCWERKEICSSMISLRPELIRCVQKTFSWRGNLFPVWIFSTGKEFALHQFHCPVLYLSVL